MTREAEQVPAGCLHLEWRTKTPEIHTHAYENVYVGMHGIPSECCNYDKSVAHRTSARPSSRILPTILCTTQVWMWKRQRWKRISSQQGKHREEKRIVSHWTSCRVQRLHEHSTAFALSQERSQPGTSRWPVPCWPSNWTTSWAANPSSTGTFRATKPQSSWHSSPEGLATRWGAQISSIAFIYSEKKTKFLKVLDDFFDALPNCPTGGRCWVGIQEVSDLRHGAQVVSDQREAQHPCQGGGVDLEQLQQGRLLHPRPRGGEVSHRKHPNWKVHSLTSLPPHAGPLSHRPLCPGAGQRPTSLRSRKCARSPRWFVTRKDTAKPASLTPARGRSQRKCSR